MGLVLTHQTWIVAGSLHLQAVQPFLSPFLRPGADAVTKSSCYDKYCFYPAVIATLTGNSIPTNITTGQYVEVRFQSDRKTNYCTNKKPVNSIYSLFWIRVSRLQLALQLRIHGGGDSCDVMDIGYYNTYSGSCKACTNKPMDDYSYYTSNGGSSASGCIWVCAFGYESSFGGSFCYRSSGWGVPNIDILASSRTSRTCAGVLGLAILVTIVATMIAMRAKIDGQPEPGTGCGPVRLPHRILPEAGRPVGLCGAGACDTRPHVRL